MPLCSFYASGCCIKVNCPYSHVYNGEKAEFCIEFAKGFCALGSKVITIVNNKTHILITLYSDSVANHI